ncbi:MAG: hypothetical protein PVS3B1_39500 [Ktedonobacteraceae bacterium]
MLGAFDGNDCSDDDERLLPGFVEYGELLSLSYNPLFGQEAETVLLLEHVCLSLNSALDLVQQMVRDDELWWNALQAETIEVVDVDDFISLYCEWQIEIDTFPDMYGFRCSRFN